MSFNDHFDKLNNFSSSIAINISSAATFELYLKFYNLQSNQLKTFVQKPTNIL